MNKCLNWFLSGLLLLAVGFTSCSESDGAENPLANWEDRNQAYIDSIAVEARNHPAEWLTLHTYRFLPDTDMGLGGNTQMNVNDYVYCKKLKIGDGVIPNFNDTVSVNYRGKLIPLLDGTEVVFDQSYQGELREEVAIPVDMSVDAVVEGFSTALQKMKVGDRWMVYIPSQLGYGSNSRPSIPSGSTLIFDLDLVEVKPLR